MDAERDSEAATSAEAAPFVPSAATLEYDFARSSTHASNQMAVWVEDESGSLVKTLFVTNFVAARRGYRKREDAVRQWVSKADPESMDDAEIDAISSATPSGGHLLYEWDFTDGRGSRVETGVYRLVLEATLYWASNVRYEAVLDMDDLNPGTVAVEEIRSQPDEPTNESMVSDVTVVVW